jgi:hypothetical protein
MVTGGRLCGAIVEELLRRTRAALARLWDADSGTELLRSPATTDKSPFGRISGIASRENG